MPLSLKIHALTNTKLIPLSHPGDVSDFRRYRRHLPEKWCPMVTLIGSVGTRSDESLDQFKLRHFELQTSVYDTSKAKPIQFSVVCYFESGKRWQKVNIPPLRLNISVTAKIVG